MWSGKVCHGVPPFLLLAGSSGLAGNGGERFCILLLIPVARFMRLCCRSRNRDMRRLECLVRQDSAWRCRPYPVVCLFLLAQTGGRGASLFSASSFLLPACHAGKGLDCALPRACSGTGLLTVPDLAGNLGADEKLGLFSSACGRTAKHCPHNPGGSYA